LNPRQLRRAGFSLIEVMVSITVLFLGVMTAGGLMVTTQQNETFSERRYQDYADLRNRMEALKSMISTSYPTAYTTSSDGKVVSSAGLTSGSPWGKTATVTGEFCTMKIDPAVAAMKNLVRIQVTVQDQGAKPVEVITYVRANEVRGDGN
jgi:prepilin-type N-terminal cleavage/methylation domain-containing protein